VLKTIIKNKKVSSKLSVGERPGYVTFSGYDYGDTGKLSRKKISLIAALLWISLNGFTLYRPLYPLESTATRYPSFSAHLATIITAGVLPVPPVVKLPILTTKPGRDFFLKRLCL
jgi:hypothetical protein